MSNSTPTQERLPQYGGQALIEGVMMRGKYAVSAAMRAPDGKIVVHTEKLPAIYKSRWMKIPFVRGLLALWDALGLGMRFLTKSAELQGEAEMSKQEEYGSIGLALVIAVGVFVYGPIGISNLAERWLQISPWWAVVLEGLLRLVLVVGYIWAVGRMPEIRRVFQYHGAEHKTINAYEARAELTPETVLTYSLEHPRCGTAFLLTLFVISLIFFTLLGPMAWPLKVLSRLVFIPALAGAAYEYIRWSAAHLDNPIVRLITRPNLALQHLTTAEPDAAIAEVAITAFNAMLEQEQILAAQANDQAVTEAVGTEAVVEKAPSL